jgi:hypothetical protein
MPHLRTPAPPKLVRLSVCALALLGTAVPAHATPIGHDNTQAADTVCTLSIHFLNSGNPTYDRDHFGAYRKAVEDAVTASNDIAQAFYQRVTGPGVKEPLHRLCLVIPDPAAAQSVKQRLQNAAANLQGGFIKP